MRSTRSSPNGRATALLAVAAAIVLATVLAFWLAAPGASGPVVDDDDPARVVHQPRSFGDVADYPADYPADAPRLAGTLLEASSTAPTAGAPATAERPSAVAAASPTWSLRYAREDYTPEAALGELTSLGFAEEGRATDAAGVTSVTLESVGTYSVTLEWSDTHDQTQLDLVVRPSR